MNPKLSIEIVSDVVWPWCYIGKRRLQSALQLFQEQAPDAAKPAVRWLPFQLNPDLPPSGISRKEYIERKFGPGAVRTYDRVAGVGKEVGIDFAFDKITVQPNTINAHRLMHYGARHEREDEVAESLFQGYFIEGAVLTEIPVLAEIGARAGLDRVALAAYLESDEDRGAVLDMDLQARQAGIGGVPFFIFNRRIAVSGAHEAETLLGAMLEALHEKA